MILIYSNEINPRIEYIFRLIFTDILRVEVSFTTKSGEFLKSDLPKLNYSYEKFNDEFYIKPHRLMYCKAINPARYSAGLVRGRKVFLRKLKRF